MVLTSSITNGILWSNNENTPSITVSTSGDYSVLLTDANGCTAVSNIITVVVDAPLVATNLGGPFTQCGGTIVLDAGNASANNNYLWSSGEVSQVIDVNVSGNYFVTITNSCGSVTSSTANVTINPLPQTPIVSPSGPLVFCQGGNVTLTSSSAVDNIWSNGLTSQGITVDTTATGDRFSQLIAESLQIAGRSGYSSTPNGGLPV